jgi:hypothetical protein
MTVLWRFADLKQHGVVNSWPQLKRLQELHGFPPGRMLSPMFARGSNRKSMSGLTRGRPRTLSL